MSETRTRYNIRSLFDNLYGNMLHIDCAIPLNTPIIFRKIKTPNGLQLGYKRVKNG